VSTTNGSVIANQYFSCAALNVESVLVICFTGYCDVCLELFWCVQKIKMYLLPLISFIKKKRVTFGDLGGVGGAICVVSMHSSLI